jgi:hypothetical protein
VQRDIDQGVPILADGVSVLVRDMDYFSARTLDLDVDDMYFEPFRGDDDDDEGISEWELDNSEEE